MKKEELFILIKSLTRSEKRYFKLSLSLDSASYLKLFDLIESQEIYNEAAIKAKLKGHKVLNQFHVGKNYLRQQILKSLRNFHSQISKDAQVKDILRNVEILYKRELFGNCKTELKRAKKMAEEFELDAMMIEILGWERKIIQATTPTDFDSIYNVVKEQKRSTDSLYNTISYWELTTDISTAVGTPRIKEFEDHVLLKNDQKAQTIQSKVLYYHSLYYTNLQSGNVDKAENSLRKLITYLEAQPNFIRHELGMYISTVNNYVTFLIFAKKHEEAFRYLEKIKYYFEEVTNNNKANKILQKQIFRTLNIELELYRDLKKYDSQNLRFIEESITNHQTKVPDEYLISFWYQLAYIHFGERDYESALHWINLLLQFKGEVSRKDLLVHGRMLNLLIHFELKNFFALGYFLDSTRRYISNYDKLMSYQKTILNLISKASKMPEDQIKSEFKKANNRLFPDHEEHEIDSDVLDYIDYKSWIEGNLK
ncbi:MAG: hypothetical protein NXI20_21920 [bacterium]|nr:hypothetical protein [bacterium]